MAVLLAASKIEEIQDEAAKTPLRDIAAYLQKNLGQKMTAYVTGLTDPKAVGSWIRGDTAPRPPADMRLRYAYQIVRMLAEAYDAQTARAWLLGSNTRLHDEAPAYLLRQAEKVEDLRQIVPTARSFAGAAA